MYIIITDAASYLDCFNFAVNMDTIALVTCLSTLVDHHVVIMILNILDTVNLYLIVCNMFCTY